MAEHLKKCSDCRRTVDELRTVLEEADGVKGEIRQAVESVDWDGFAARVTDRVFHRIPDAERRDRAVRFRLWSGLPKLKPVLAGLSLGLVLGSLAMYLILRQHSSVSGVASTFFASGEVLDKVELEMARRETLDYLQKSQYLLLDVVQSPPSGDADWPGFGSDQARELLSKKKYLNAQLDKYQMAKAKAICDQIELLFLELMQVSKELSQAELENIQNIIRDRQLLLKINLVRKELENREV